MLGKIINIKNSTVFVQLSINIYTMDNLIGKNVTFDDKHIGEVVSANGSIIEINLIGELANGMFISGGMSTPAFGASCKLSTKEEIDLIYGVSKNSNSLKLGKSYIYDDYDIHLNVNSFFSNHFAIFGNSGSGKSHFVAKLFQSIFYDTEKLAYNTNIFLFDAYGEYQQAFKDINKNSKYLNYKVITTDLREQYHEKLKIPFWLLSVDDICLLLSVDDQRQIPIIEKALKLVVYFSLNGNKALAHKNNIIASALLDIIYSNGNSIEAHNVLVNVLNRFYTNEINLNVVLTKGGWSRTIRQCLHISDNGSFADIEVVIEYLEKFCGSAVELTMPDGSCMYNIQEFYDSLEFALVSEGIYSNSSIFDYANALKIKLNNLLNNDYVNYFKCDEYFNKESYIKYLLTASNGGKCQLINFNINYVDDRFAKTIVKIFSKLLFDYTTILPERASVPFHIVLEEAHRYVQDDSDKKILGYNIFERITKEGRKYGIMLGLISQRPLELSETAVSQCSNFVVFKIFHPQDIKFVSSVINGMSSSVIEKVKNLTAGSCILFGTAVKFPVLTKVDMPDPTPLSQSCNIDRTWYTN